MRILVIDDDVELAGCWGSSCSAKAFRWSARTTAGRVRLPPQGQIELVVLDVMLPGMDGFEILRRCGRGPGASADADRAR